MGLVESKSEGYLVCVVDSRYVEKELLKRGHCSCLEVKEENR